MFWKYLYVHIYYEQLVKQYMTYDNNFVIYSWFYTPNKSFYSWKWDTFQHMKGDNFHKYCQYCLKIGQHPKHTVEVSSQYICNFFFNEYFSMSYYMLNSKMAAILDFGSKGFFVTRQNIFFVIFE